MESGNPKIPRRMKVSRELAKTEMIRSHWKKPV